MHYADSCIIESYMLDVYFPSVITRILSCFLHIWAVFSRVWPDRWSLVLSQTHPADPWNAAAGLPLYKCSPNVCLIQYEIVVQLHIVWDIRLYVTGLCVHHFGYGLSWYSFHIALWQSTRFSIGIERFVCKHPQTTRFCVASPSLII